MTSAREPRLVFASLLLALAAAASLRLLVLDQKPLWCDELATVQRLGLTFGEHVQAMKGNHPLYELLLRLWMPPDGSDVRLRIPSALLGVLAVWLTWRLVRGVGWREGLVAAWLMALSPLAVMYSRIGRAYSLSCFLAAASNLALLWAIRRRRALPFAAYALVTALLVYSNLFAISLWAAQGLFLLWFYGRRIVRLGGRQRLARRLAPWLAAHAAAALLLLPWMLYSLPGAATWSVETKYTAQQFGTWAKACYLPFTLCVGETVHPLNLAVVVPAFIGFGLAFITAAFCAWRRRRTLAQFLLVQVVVVVLIGLFFASAAPKHLMILLPAWMGLVAIGATHLRRPWMRVACVLLVTATMYVSLFNYFANRQFADADMVTPWREMAATVGEQAASQDVILIGYQPDSGAFDMFRRYYRGKGRVERLNFSDWLRQVDSAGQPDHAVWLLLHDGDPWVEVEFFLGAYGFRQKTWQFQMEEHTLQGLREGWRNAGKYRSPLYRLYRCEPVARSIP